MKPREFYFVIIIMGQKLQSSLSKLWSSVWVVALALLWQVEKTQAQTIDVLTDITITPTEITFVARPVDEQTGQIYPLRSSGAYVYDSVWNTYPYTTYNTPNSKVIVVTRPISGQIAIVFSQLKWNSNWFPSGWTNFTSLVEEVNGKVTVAPTPGSQRGNANEIAANWHINETEITPEQITCVDGKIRIDMSTNGNIGTGVIDSSGTIASRLPATLQLVDAAGNPVGALMNIDVTDLDANGAWLSDELPDGTVVWGLILVSDDDRRQDITFSAPLMITALSDIDTIAWTSAMVTNNPDNTTATFQSPQIVDTNLIQAVTVTYGQQTLYRTSIETMPKSLSIPWWTIQLIKEGNIYKVIGLVRGSSDQQVSMTLHGCNAIAFSWLVEASTVINGVDQVEDMQELSVYPNPATDFITIKWLENQNFDYKILRDGTAVYEGENQNGTIDVANFPQGMYFLKVIPLDGDTRPRVLKFVKMN